MKHFLLAAAALVAVPALAQTSGSTGTSSPTTAGAQTSPTTAAPAGDASMATDQATTTPTPQTDPAMTQQAPAGAPMQAQTTGGTESAGGYQPAQPALQGTPQPGAPVVFQQAPDPSTAFPPPAAQESYPVCKKGQYDKCRQRGGK